MASMIQAGMTARALMRQHIPDSGWSFAWDNAKRRGGAAHFDRRTITLSRNLVPLWTDAQVEDVILHEIAHVIAGYQAAHGPVWRAACRKIGASPDRTHDNETVPGRYLATCNKCDKEVGRKHRMSPAMRQGRHVHRNCGGSVSWLDTGLVGV